MQLWPQQHAFSLGFLALRDRRAVVGLRGIVVDGYFYETAGLSFCQTACMKTSMNPQRTINPDIELKTIVELYL